MTGYFCNFRKIWNFYCSATLKNIENFFGMLSGNCKLLVPKVSLSNLLCNRYISNTLNIVNRQATKFQNYGQNNISINNSHLPIKHQWLKPNKTILQHSSNSLFVCKPWNNPYVPWFEQNPKLQDDLMRQVSWYRLPK